MKKVEKKENKKLVNNSVWNICMNENKRKNNLECSPETVLNGIRETVNALAKVKTDILLDAMNDSETVEEMEWIADILAKAFPLAVHEWRQKKNATVDDLDRYIELWGTKQRSADIEEEEPEEKPKKAKKTTEKKVEKPAKAKAEKKATTKKAEPKKTTKKATKETTTKKTTKKTTIKKATKKVA